MEKIRAHSISMFTLGVESVERSVRFYEALGWEHSPDSDPGMCTFMITDNIALGLVEYDFLAKDALLPVSPKRPYYGFSMAINGADPDEVDEIYRMAVEAGGAGHQKPQWKDWGGYDGYSGYFLDPDGYAWEVAYAPFLRLDDTRRLLPRRKEETI
ncbi:MAG: VOC family protein [Clostridiales bacterium]|nr:VOC family protein [Clostridiales bacterium]